MEQILEIDVTIPNPTDLDYCLNKLAPRALKDKIIVSWRAPFSTDLHIGDVVIVEDVATVRLTNIHTESESVRHLFKSDSTKYTGEAIGALL